MITPYQISHYFSPHLYDGWYENDKRIRYTTSWYIKNYLIFTNSLYLPFIIDVGYKTKLLIIERN